MGKNPHSYHYWEDKNFAQKLVDFAVPLGLFILFLAFYNEYKITPSEMVKTTGLWSISLLGITLIVGPLSKVFLFFNFLKAHRKFWGIVSVLIAMAHVSLVFVYFYKFDLTRFWNFANPKYPGIASGLLALTILLLVTFTSNQKALTKLSPKTWKIIQTTSYLALALAVAHFYLMETKDGVLVINRLLGQVTFGFSILVIVARVLVMFLPQKK